eukprot:g82318.t1
MHRDQNAKQSECSTVRTGQQAAQRSEWPQEPLTCVDTSHPKKDLTVHQASQVHSLSSNTTSRAMLSFSYDLRSKSVRMAKPCLLVSGLHFSTTGFSQLLHEARSKETHNQKCKRINHTQQSQRSFPFPSPTFYSQFNSLPTLTFFHRGKKISSIFAPLPFENSHLTFRNAKPSIQRNLKEHWHTLSSR